MIGQNIYNMKCWDQATINILMGVNMVFPFFILFSIITLHIDQTIYCKTLYWKILYLMELLVCLIQITAYPFTIHNICDYDEGYKFDSMMNLNLLVLILSFAYILCYATYCLV